jgi:hypothetical protein
VLLLGIAGALLVVGGCSDDDTPAAQVTTTTAPAASGTSAPPETDTTTAGALPDEPGLADEGIGALDELAQSLLIQEGELGDPPLADVGYTPGVTGAVCGGDVDTPHPADVLVGVVLESDTTAVVEEIRVFADADAATAAYDAIMTATGCGAASSVSPDVPADRAALFQAAGIGTFVLAQTADTVLAFHVTGEGLDPVEVAAFGAGKVAAALEN